MNDTDHALQADAQAARHKRIIELIQRDGYVRVFDLSKLLDVSEITIRRDLALMEKEQLLERTHGGAISTTRIYKETKYSKRSDLHRENKDAIARRAAELIQDGDTVFINGGSTTFHVFRYIARANLKIVTINAGCIGQVMNPEVELILAGGQYYPESNSFYGGFTTGILSQINASKAILGVHGISCRYGLTTPMQYAAEATRLMIERTRGEVIVVADHTKIGVVSDYVTVTADRINTLVTDWLPEQDYSKDFESLGIRVIQTNPRQ